MYIDGFSAISMIKYQIPAKSIAFL